MSISVYDVNTFLKNDTDLANIAGKTMNIFPVVATDGEPAPYLVYFYHPIVSNVETYWERCDYVRYSVFDTNVDRLFKISDRIVNLLSIGDGVNGQDGIVSSNYRILSSYQIGAGVVAPLEINGLYRMNLDFKMVNVVK